MIGVGMLAGTALLLAWPIGRALGSSGKEDPIARGKYLVNAMGCTDCHTPVRMTATGPVPDASRLLAGHPSDVEVPAVPSGADRRWAMYVADPNTAFAGAWGVSYAANLTPHATGMGVWSEEMFIQAMRTGKRMGVGRGMLPPMPWPGYAQMTDDDLRAIFVYLRTIPPVENVVPAATAPPGGTSAPTAGG